MFLDVQWRESIWIQKDKISPHYNFAHKVVLIDLVLCQHPNLVKLIDVKLAVYLQTCYLQQYFMLE
jgi:hypothetical protein